MIFPWGDSVFSRSNQKTVKKNFEIISSEIQNPSLINF